MRSLFRLAFLAALLGGCANIFRDEEAVPNPPPSAERGVVLLFNGLTFPFEGNTGTGTYTLAENIRRAGVRAEIDRPSAWQDVAERFLRDWTAQPQPVAIYGYSYGAQAALRVARRLGEAGIPVQTLVVLEAFRPVPVPCNVREALHIFIPNTSLIQVTALSPERPGCTRIRNSRFVPRGRTPFWLDHWSISTSAEFHLTVQEQLLDGRRVRMRPAGSGAPRSAGGHRAEPDERHGEDRHSRRGA